MTQGKIERWHQTLKNRIGKFLPGDLEAQIAAFPIDDYNHRRYYESINDLTPTDVNCGRGSVILANDKGSNDRPVPTLACRPPGITPSMRQKPPLIYPARCLKNLTTDSHRR
jgi:hypothetical protein